MTETQVLHVCIPGRPIAWARAGRSGHASFTPRRYATWKKKAQAVMLASCGRRPFTGPVVLKVYAAFGGPGVRRPHVARPDADNILKGVLDAGNGILWGDDAQVHHIEMRKARGDSSGGAYVSVHAEGPA